jgi:hypothetical protein
MSIETGGSLEEERLGKVGNPPRDVAGTGQTKCLLPFSIEFERANQGSRDGIGLDKILRLFSQIVLDVGRNVSCDF